MQIEQDKLKHFAVCFIISLTVSQIAFWLLPHLGSRTIAGSSMIGGITAYLAGVAKEWYDSNIKGTFADPEDLEADVAGCTMGMLINIIICFL